MNKLMNRIPIEIIYHILSYSYKPQPLQLQKDIISYVNTKTEIMEIFHLRYHINSNAIKNHFTFHIESFLTALPNTYVQFENILDEVYTRLFVWNQTPTKKHQVSHKVLWGLLKVEEREQFMRIQKNMDKHRMP